MHHELRQEQHRQVFARLTEDATPTGLTIDKPAFLQRWRTYGA
jgi:hypothetical protein